MSGGVASTSIFDPSKYYRRVLNVPGQLRFDFDAQEQQEILDYYLRKLIMDVSKCSIVVVPLISDPIKYAEEEITNLPTDGIFEFEMIDATHVKWRKNGGAWDDNAGPGYAVTCDGVTVNSDVGASGLNIVFNATALILHAAHVSVGYAVKFLGDDPKYDAGVGAYKVVVPRFDFAAYGYRIAEVAATVDIPAPVYEHFMYFDVWTEVIEYTADYDFAHKLADGSYNEPSPDRLKLKWDLKVAANIPDPATGHTHIPYARTRDQGSGVLEVVPLMIDFGERVLTPTERDELHAQNTDTHTTQSKLYVDGTPITGKEVLVRQSVATIPLHLEATETGLSTDFWIHKADKGRMPSLPKAWIKIEWNDHGTGTGALKTFTVTSARVTSVSNEWIGYWLQDKNGDLFKVDGNTAGATPVFSLESGTPATGAYAILSGGNGYHVVIKRHKYILGVPQDYYINRDSFSSDRGLPIDPAYPPTSQIWFVHDLEPGEEIKVLVAACGSWFQNHYSAYTEIETQAYNYAIPDSSACITSCVLTAMDTGFQVRVAIHTDYKEKIQLVEVAWTDDGSAPNFDSHRTYIMHVTEGANPIALAAIPAAIVPNPTKKYRVRVRGIDTLGRETNGYVAATQIDPASAIITSMEELILGRDGEVDLITKINKFNADVARMNGIIDSSGDLTRKAMLQAQAATCQCLSTPAYHDDDEYESYEDATWVEVGNRVTRRKPSFMSKLRIMVHLMTSVNGEKAYFRVNFKPYGGATVTLDPALETADDDTAQPCKEGAMDIACVGGAEVEIWCEAKGTVAGAPPNAKAIVDFIAIDFTNY